MILLLNLLLMIHICRLGSWDEIQDYLPQHNCQCGGSRVLLGYFHQEQVMQFLMGLNDSFNQVKSQILLMTPFPPINQVFSMVLQKEKQREITFVSSETQSHVAFAAQSSTKEKFINEDKDKPVCTHWGRTGHTINRCFK